MKPYKFVWSTHRWIGIVVALVLLNSAITGFFLLVKKDYAWIQPPTQSGSEGNIADFISFQKLSTVIEQLQHPDFSDANAIDRATLDLRAGAARFVYTPDGLRERMLGLQSSGATEVMWQPMGKDIPREMRAFAEAVGLGDGVMAGS